MLALTPAGSKDNVLGKTISHYRVLEPLGRGGMGVVYRAEDERLGRDVALKFLPEELSGNRQALERFKREARAASALSHPNICTIYDVGEIDGRSFIAMEFLEGETLQKRIGGRALPNPEILEIGLQLAGALDAAHAKGIIHRDIKPANVIVDRSGQAKLLDFGLASIEPLRARPVSGDSETAMPDAGLTSPGSALGTVAYMAPEQARGEEVDARSDLFAFGAVLYEMATGRPAFGGATLALIFDNILRREPAAPQRLNAALLPGLEQVILKALAKDREERYQSAADMRADLRRLRRESESGQAAVVAGTPVRRRRAGLYAGLGSAAAILVAMVGAGAYFYRSRTFSAPVARQTEWAPVTNFADSAVSPAISADGRMLTFIRGSDTFYGTGQVYVKFLPDGEPVQLTRDSAEKMAPAFSSDGSRIAYTQVASSWNTWIVPVLGGDPRLMLANAEALTWIDTKQLLFSEIRKGLHMVLVSAGENREASREVYVPPRERGMAHRSAISPDHKWVLLTHMDNGGWLPCLLVPFDGSSAGRAVGPLTGGCTYVGWSPDGEWMYFSSDAGGRFHIWRQRLAGGEPEQITSGATEEEGIAVAPDGRSLITSVGLVQSTVVVHDAQGEREVSSGTYAQVPQFSPDGKYAFYLSAMRGAGGHRFTSGELYRVDLSTSVNERLLSGYLMTAYAISPNGREVVFSAPDRQEHLHLWTAELDLRSAPRQFSSLVDEDQPNFDADGNIYFRAAEGRLNFLYRMKPDGSGRIKVLSTPILEVIDISPDGRRAIVWQAATKERDAADETVAASLGAGAPVTLCADLCSAMWGDHGRLFAIQTAGGERTIFIRVPPSGLPALPADGLNDSTRPDSLKGAQVLNGILYPGPEPGQYASLHASVHRNLYRIALH